MKVPDRIAEAARGRIDAASAPIDESRKQIEAGTPLRAEPDRDRAIDRVAAVVGVDAVKAGRIVDYVPPHEVGLSEPQRRKAEALQGRTVDYVGVAWLDAARTASKAVARIATRDGQPLGTGFLTSSRLLITNNHVIGDPRAAAGLVAEFRYELGVDQTSPSPVRFEFDPGAFFVTDDTDDLDFTLLAVGRPLDGASTLAPFGICPLSASAAKHSVGEPVNIVQHPDGDVKQVVVRENRILHRGDAVLHYLADTEPGASGSPVFNDEWQVVALHHWGEPHRERSARGGALLRTDVNEGIRASAIVEELKKRAPRLDANQRRLLEEALSAPPPGKVYSRTVGGAASRGPQTIVSEPFEPNPPHAPDQPDQPDQPDAPFAREAPEASRGGPPANRIDLNYGSRRGYNERFLKNFPLPMPQLSAPQRATAARVRGVGESARPFELKYEHFSVVMNAERRMAFFSICNIDGAKRNVVVRGTGKSKSGPEATEVWAVDPRIPLEAQLSDAFYARVRRDLRISNEFFARGHLTRREDPDWGPSTSAERADADTFHHPNACPQVQNAFNGSQKAWQGIENFVLNSADDSNLRVTVITGPVFDDQNDPVYEDSEFGPVAFPRRFWKIVARVEDETPLVFAVLADQSVAMDQLFNARRPEALFDWPKGKLSEEFKSTVAEIAELTGLDFGDLADHDVFAGAERAAEEVRERVRRPEDLFPRRRSSGDGFGLHPSIGAFLESWEAKEAKEAREAREAAKGAEKKPPPPRKRLVVEVEAVVVRLFPDDLSGARHQQFAVRPTKLLKVDPAAAKDREDVEKAIQQHEQVRVAVRFGDSRGLTDRIPGIRTGVKLHLKGEWISAESAFSVGGERLAVLHFTHDPLGFVCTPLRCFS